MNKSIDEINGCSWADWSLNRFEIDYEKILIEVSEDELNVTVIIRCKDYIGFNFVGHWDESVIQEITVERKGILIDESLQIVKKLYGENPQLGGGVKKIDNEWYQVNIKLIDGNTIKIACKSVEAELIGVN